MTCVHCGGETSEYYGRLWDGPSIEDLVEGPRPRSLLCPKCQCNLSSDQIIAYYEQYSSPEEAAQIRKCLGKISSQGKRLYAKML